MSKLSAVVLLATLSACADGAERERSLAFTFVPEVPASADEAYLCFAFDAGALSEGVVRGVEWSAPAGGTVLHHAKLYVTSESRPTQAAFACDPMPSDAITLHVWAPGASALELPKDVGLQLPAAMRTLVVEAHALRSRDGPAAEAEVAITVASAPPAKVASWLGLRAPVPAIRPLTHESGSSRCRFSAAFHLLFAWPHMHTVGVAFHADRVRDEDASTLIDVESWDFAEQHTYQVDVELQADDAVEMRCDWQNPTTEYVLPGALTENEMCNLGLIGWPPEGASCTYEDAEQ